jgi:hypothetical protein
MNYANLDEYCKQIANKASIEKRITQETYLIAGECLANQE